MSEMTREQEIREAVARGWCDPANSHKEMDSILAESIVREVLALALTARSEGFREGVEAAARVCDTYLWAPVCAAAIRTLSPRETDAGPQAEQAWLIEAPHVRPVKYWAGEDWTDDPTQAKRFHSKETADAEIHKHTLLNFDDDGNNRILPVEHMFGCGTSS